MAAFRVMFAAGFLAIAAATTATPASIDCVAKGKGLRVTEVGRWFTGDVANPVEIFDTDMAAGRIYYVGGTDAVTILSISADRTKLELAGSFSVGEGMRANSLDVKKGLLAVAVSNATHPWAAGEVHVYDAEGTLKVKAPVGALPDSLTWHPWNNKIYVACEGEPQSQSEAGSDPLQGANPAGAVVVVNVQQNATRMKVTMLSFLDYFAAMPEAQYQALLQAGLRIDPRLNQSSAGLDIEPEYIVVNPGLRRAFVTLQEANAIAVVDTSSDTIVDVWPMGLKDWSKFKLDASDRGAGINMRSWPNLFSWYQPDTIVSATISGVPYLFTANEGDTKEEYLRVKDSAFVLDPVAFPAALDVKNDANLGRLNADTLFGFKEGCGYNLSQDWNKQSCPRDKIIFTGGRSFSIFNALTGELVWDSGDMIEALLAADPSAAPIFNSDNDENTFRTRSDNKGPEPEAIEVFRVGGKHYAAVALERQGGLMFFDVSNPAAPAYVGYLSDRVGADKTALGLEAAELAAMGVSLGPEGVKFTKKGGDSLLMTANELSGHLVVYAVKRC